jgi:hypothetical protein
MKRVTVVLFDTLRFYAFLRTESLNNKTDRHTMYCTYKRNIEAHARSLCCHRKAVNITCFECVSVALVIQHAMRMRRSILSSVAVWLYHIFSLYLINDTIFEKKD